MATLQKEQALEIIDIQIEQMEMIKNTLSIGDFEYEAATARRNAKNGKVMTLHEKIENITTELKALKHEVEHMDIFQIWKLDSRKFIFQVTRSITDKYRLSDSLRTVFEFNAREEEAVKLGKKARPDSNFREYWNKGKDNVAFFNEINKEDITEYEIAGAFARRRIAKRNK